VEHVVDRLGHLEVVDHVVLQEHEALVADVLDVLERAGVEVVDADDAVAVHEEAVTQVGTEETGAPGNE